MDEHFLDNAITRLRKQSQAEPPTNFEQNVWRRIRLEGEGDRTNLEEMGIIDTIYKVLFLSRWVIPTAAVAIVFSTFASTVAIANAQPSQEKAARALGFDSITDAPRLHIDGSLK